MRARLLLALVLAAVVLFSAQVASADDPVVVDFRIDSPPVVTVGDRIGYEIVLELDAGTAVAFTAAALPPEVELVEAPETTRVVLADGRERVTIAFELAPFVPGTVMLPPMPVRFEGADGASGIVETTAGVIEVASVLPVAGQVTPRDLKPQAAIGESPPAWPLPVVAGLAAALALVLVAVLVRRRVRRYNAVRALRAIPELTGPEDVARVDLDSTASEFQTSGNAVALYRSLGATVRQYLAERYGFPAFALTTRELETEMLKRGLDRWQVRVAGGLLAQCDAVVYAGYRPAADRSDADLTAAYEIVEMSRPGPEVVSEAGVAS